HEFLLALALPKLAQPLRIERSARAVAEVDDLVPDAGGDEPVCLRARHALRHLFELFDFEETAYARPNFTALDERRALRHRFVRTVEIHRHDPNARVQREIPDHGFEVRHDPRHRARAFREDERVVTTIKKRLRMTQRLPQRTRALHR